MLVQKSSAWIFNHVLSHQQKYLIQPPTTLKVLQIKAYDWITIQNSFTLIVYQN